MIIERKSLIEKLKDRAKAMPMVFVYITAAAVVLEGIIGFDRSGSGWGLFVILLSGVLFSGAGYQWNSVLKLCGDKIMQVAIAVFLLIAYVITLCSTDFFHHPVFYVLIMAGFCGILFVPSRGFRSDNWCYTARTVETILFGLAASVVMGVVSVIIIFTLSVLFDFENTCFSAILSVTLSFFLPLVVSFCILPMADSDIPVRRWIKNIGLYFLLPVVVFYEFILYIYLIKILVTWSLPTGLVSSLISGFLLVSFALWWTFSGPGTLADRKSFEVRAGRFVKRILPWTMLPLLILMSVAVGYRIAEYGITPSRLYLATFNIWAYFAVLYIASCRKAKADFTAWSFALLFTIVTIIPGFNFTQFSVSCVESSLKTDMRAMGFEAFPVPLDFFAEAAAELPEKEYESLSSKIDILCDAGVISDVLLSDNENDLRLWQIRSRVYDYKDSHVVSVEPDSSATDSI